jgi:hypothetical protein
MSFDAELDLMFARAREPLMTAATAAAPHQTSILKPLNLQRVELIGRADSFGRRSHRLGNSRPPLPIAHLSRVYSTVRTTSLAGA